MDGLMAPVLTQWAGQSRARHLLVEAAGPRRGTVSHWLNRPVLSPWTTFASADRWRSSLQRWDGAGAEGCDRCGPLPQSQAGCFRELLLWGPKPSAAMPA